MLKISKFDHILSFTDDMKPVAQINSGEQVIFETFDCFSNKIEREDQLFSSVGWESINPATGPLYVNGAEPGDILKVDILDIQLIGVGVTATAPGHGVYGALWSNEKTRIIPIHNSQVCFNKKIHLQAEPMIGVIGTAPACGQSYPTGTPHEHGGNMDCKEIKVGASLYLPVNVDGALLAMGDLHAVMGDGEVSVCGIEIAGNITVRITVLKDIQFPLPMIKNDTHLMTIFSAETLDNAANGAAMNMHKFATEILGIDKEEAAMLLSAAADLRICQVVDPLKTCRMELPLSIVKEYGFIMP